MKKAIYYVYVWFRTDKNEVFYVGKGKGNRSHDMGMRNRHFLNVVNKVGTPVDGATVTGLTAGVNVAKNTTVDFAVDAKDGYYITGVYATVDAGTQSALGTSGTYSVTTGTVSLKVDVYVEALPEIGNNTGKTIYVNGQQVANDAWSDFVEYNSDVTILVPNGTAIQIMSGSEGNCGTLTPNGTEGSYDVYILTDVVGNVRLADN